MNATIMPTSVAAFCRRVVFPLFVMAALSGCANPIYQGTGVVLSAYAEAEATPYVLQMSDVDMACNLGTSLDPLVYSFERVIPAPDETGSLLQLLAGNCSETRAFEAELEYLRADYQGNVPAAKDARIRSKRLHKITAERRLMAFRRAMRAYEYDVNAENPECPFLYNDQDELTFLTGVLTGMQAIINDTNSGGAAGVPKNIAPQAERAAQCVDNEKWGGLPNAIRATVWLLLPDTRPDLSPDPFRVLKNSSELGVEMGMRTSMALEAVAAETFGREDVLRDVLKRYAATKDDEGFEVSKDYRLVDAAGVIALRHISDKYWTSEYGHRTPRTYMGQLDKGSGSKAEAMDLEGLL